MGVRTQLSLHFFFAIFWATAAISVKENLREGTPLIHICNCRSLRGRSWASVLLGDATWYVCTGQHSYQHTHRATHCRAQPPAPAVATESGALLPEAPPTVSRREAYLLLRAFPRSGLKPVSRGGAVRAREETSPAPGAGARTDAPEAWPVPQVTAPSRWGAV